MIRSILNLIASFRFWLVRKTLKEGRDFTCEQSDESFTPIFRICRGKFAGVKFIVLNMRVTEDGNGAILNFDTRLVDVPKNISTEDKNLEKQLGKLSSNIVRLYLLKYVEMEKQKDESGKIDIVESNDEREFHEESPAVPERRVSSRRNRKESVSDDPLLHRKVQRVSKPKRAKNTTGRTKKPDGE